MANPSQRHQDSNGKGRAVLGTELKNMNHNMSPTPGASEIAMPDTSCKPIHCQEARQRYRPPDLAGDPWQLKKTIYLIGLIVSLIIWAIIYGILLHMKVV